MLSDTSAESVETGKHLGAFSVLAHSLSMSNGGSCKGVPANLTAC